MTSSGTAEMSCLNAAGGRVSLGVAVGEGEGREPCQITCQDYLRDGSAGVVADKVNVVQVQLLDETPWMNSVTGPCPTSV